MRWHKYAVSNQSGTSHHSSVYLLRHFIAEPSIILLFLIKTFQRFLSFFFFFSQIYRNDISDFRILTSSIFVVPLKEYHSFLYTYLRRSILYRGIRMTNRRTSSYKFIDLLTYPIKKSLS